MSNAMGTADKEPIRLVIILANQTFIKNYDYFNKLKKIVNCIGTKFAELFLTLREDFEFRGFEIVYHDCFFTDFRKKLTQVNRDKPDIILSFFVGRFSHFVSSNNQFINYFLIPEKMMKSLPKDVIEQEKWSRDSRNKLGELLSHIIHEMCHSLGAFHADTGIMKRNSDLLDDEATCVSDLKLLDLLDSKTVTIICESMSIITTLKPQRDLKFIDGELAYKSDQSIAAVFFANKQKYNNEYTEFTYLDARKTFSTNVPEEWDVFVVVHFCGHIFQYSKEDVLSTRICTRAIEF